MEKAIVNTTAAPEPIGPYSQAVKAAGFLFISGQVAFIPGTGELVLDNIENEAKQVMMNLEAILTEAGYDFTHVVKSSIFLSDMDDFAAVNKVYGGFFSSNFPARETVAVKTLPKSVNVEISMIAYK